MNCNSSLTVSFLVDLLVQLAKQEIVKILLTINSLVICINNKLKLFISYPDYMTILAKLGIIIRLYTAI